jgi:hypothetical protein
VKKCQDCKKKTATVITPHRVVGKGCDVTGGPNELYCSDCAARKIYELRGEISKLLNCSD